jgi:hypothetical protein
MFERAAQPRRETIDAIEDFASSTNESVPELVRMLGQNKSSSGSDYINTVNC